MRTALFLIPFLLIADSSWAAGLSGDQLKEQIVGKTCTWANGKMRGTSVYASDRSAKVTDPSGVHVGTWRISGDRLCDKFPKWRKGKESCFTFDEVAPGTLKGSIGFTAT